MKISSYCMLIFIKCNVIYIPSALYLCVLRGRVLCTDLSIQFVIFTAFFFYIKWIRIRMLDAEICNWICYLPFKKNTLNPLNVELNPICHLLALLGGSTIVVVSRLRVNIYISLTDFCELFSLVATVYFSLLYKLIVSVPVPVAARSKA